MISKIVPHIRRATVVRDYSEYRKIASGEWIVFRSDLFYPNYLRHFLISDIFHSQFMGTVSGVGGSLLRARPAEVAKIKIPLPPLEEQRRIAVILDKAEALRVKRREAIVKLDQLLQSVFMEMFGNVESNSKKWSTGILEELVCDSDRVNYGVVQPGDEYPGGVPLIRVGDINDGYIDMSFIKKIDPDLESSYSRSRLKGNELLVSCVGSIGVVADVNKNSIGFNIARALTRVPLKNIQCRPFVREMLRSNSLQSYFKKNTRTVSQPTLNVEFVKKSPIFFPPLDLQIKFSEISDFIDNRKKYLIESEIKLNSLVHSLQDKFFK